jgi:hypothetical protein
MAPPSEWGPPAWAFIFSVIDEMEEYPWDTSYYRMFFESLKGVLPCEKCRNHYIQYTETNPPPVWSREATRTWAETLRNKIHKEQKHEMNIFDIFRF